MGKRGRGIVRVCVCVYEGYRGGGDEGRSLGGMCCVLEGGRSKGEFIKEAVAVEAAPAAG